MNLIPTPEHDAFRAAVRAFVETKAPPAEVRRLSETSSGYDASVWRQLSDQLDLPGLAVPETAGGSGSGWVETAIVMEEMGRGLFPSPYLGTAVMATAALVESPDDDVAVALLAAIAGGNVIVAVALPQPTVPAPLPTAVIEAGTADWHLDGQCDFVIDGESADVLLVPATTSQGTQLFKLAAAADGVTKTALRTLDRTRRQATVELHDVTAVPVGDVATTGRALDRASDITAVAVAAEQLGGAARCLEAAVSYAGMRHQFGRPIGSFQAVKHMCSDMLVEVESARSTVAYAAWVADNDPDELPVAASLSKACASDAFAKVSALNIQVHGGIGFTWEHDAHLYYRRAHSTALLFGDPHWHRLRLARSLGLG